MAGSDPSESVHACHRTDKLAPDQCPELAICLQDEESTPLERGPSPDPPAPAPSIAKTIPQLAVAAICLILSVLFNLTILAVIHERVPRSMPPLPDITFAILPKNSAALDISEYAIIFMTTNLLLVTLLHRHRSLVFRRLCLILTVLYLLRGISMAVTQLPVANPDYYCSPQLNITHNFQWWNFTKIVISRVSHMSLGMGLSVNGRHSFCGDYIFSGHTVMLVTTFLFLDEYWLSSRRGIAWRLLKFTYFVLVCTGIVCILVSRGHYMVDIVLAYFITSRVFFIYHCACDYALHRPRLAGGNRFRKIWWYTLFSYVESDTIKYQVKVDNTFDISELYCCKRGKS